MLFESIVNSPNYPIVGTRRTIAAFAILKTSLSMFDVVLISVLIEVEESEHKIQK